MSPTPRAEVGVSREIPWWVAVAAVGVVVLVLWGQIRHYGLLGFDSYPLIGASRVSGVSDFLGQFTEPLMAGRYPSRMTPQGFPLYRPLVNMTFALDYGLWGLEPAGYQATNLLWFAGCALALFGLARRAAGPGASVAPLLALGVFLLHPAQFEVLPVPPRRAETMCCLFMALALTFQFPRGGGPRRRAGIVSLLATLAAVASKETAFVLPVLVFVAAWVHASRATARGAVMRALVATAPHVAAVAAMLLVRVITVGLGGGGAVLRDLVVKAPLTGWSIARGVLFPQDAATTSWFLIGFLVALAALGGVAATRSDDELRAAPAPAGLVGLGLVGIAWVGSVCLIYAAAGSLQPWYLLLPAAGWALVLGAVVETVVRVAARGDGVLRAAAVAASVLAVVFVAVHLRYSPVVHRYDEPRLASALAAEFLGETERRIENASAGTTVEAPPLPIWVTPAASGPTLHGAAVLSDYSVQAWAELSFPDRRVAVRMVTGAVAPAGPDEIVLAITRSGTVQSGSR